MRSRNWSATRPATLTGKCSAGCATLGGSQRYSRPRVKSLRAGLQQSRVWSGGSKRAGADPGSKIRLEPFREPGSVPAKPPGSLGSMSEPGVAAGLPVVRPPASSSISISARPADRGRFETAERHVTVETSPESQSSTGSSTKTV